MRKILWYKFVDYRQHMLLITLLFALLFFATRLSKLKHVTGPWSQLNEIKRERFLILFNASRRFSSLDCFSANVDRKLIKKFPLFVRLAGQKLYNDLQSIAVCFQFKCLDIAIALSSLPNSR